MSSPRDYNAVMDTHPDAAAKQVEWMRAAGPQRRFEMARSLTRSVVQLAKRALRRRLGDVTPQELDRAFVALHYGEDVARLMDA